MRKTRQISEAMSLIELLVLISILALLISIMFPAIHKIREQGLRGQCQNHMRQMGLAIHQYHDSHHIIPPATEINPETKFCYLSWQARILPWLEQDVVWHQTVEAFAMNPAFSAPQHGHIRSLVYSFYICPSDGRRQTTVVDLPPIGFTHYLGVNGQGTLRGVLILNGRHGLASVTDGASHTIMVGERPPSPNERYGWWYAGVGQSGDGALDSHMSVRQINVSIYAPTCVYGPYKFQWGSSKNICNTFHFWSQHPNGANFLFADGSVKFLTYESDSILPALATIAGRETVTLP